MNDIAISVQNVSKCYKIFEKKRARFLHSINPKYNANIDETWALKDISFEIKRGESVAIIGRNGGGKSTLLEIITGTLTPTTGKVTVNGRVSALLELGSGFNPEYTGRDNVILNGLLLGLSRQEILNRFDEIEAFAEIGLAIDRPVKTYSSGMMMRLAFAVQVLCDPDILIIDEALSVGDFFFQQKCLGFIRKLSEKGVTLLFVSHDMGTVRDICMKGVLLEAGSLAFCGDKIEAIQRYLSSERPEPHAVMESSQIRSNEDKKYALNQPLWERNEPYNTEKASLMAVNLLDQNNQPCTSVTIGSEVIIQALFISPSTEPVHVSVVFKNKYDQILTAMGSYTLRTQMPSEDCGNTFIFQLKIKLTIETGNYSFSVKLGQPQGIGKDALLFDETPWLGPIQVVWNYQNEIPPFYGMVGLPAEAKFLTETSYQT